MVECGGGLVVELLTGRGGQQHSGKMVEKLRGRVY